MYTVLNVGEATGTDTFPSAIEGNGYVTGYFINFRGEAHAFLWGPATGELFDMGTLPGTNASFGASVNAHGQIAGWCDGPSATARKHATRWEAWGAMIDLEPAGGSGSQAYAINDAGETAGSLHIPNGVVQAARWEASGKAHQLGSLGGNSWARGINNAGQIVGMSEIPGGKQHAFLWDRNQTPQMSDLTVRLGIQIVNVTALADQRLSGILDAGGVQHAFVADLSTNTVRDLGAASTAEDVNRQGAAVGTAAGSAHRALLFEAGAAIDLNSRILSGSGWLLEQARGINDNGWITGSGRLNGQPSRGFVLRPSSKGSSGRAVVAAVVQILSGIIGGSGGWELTLNGRVVHVPPGNPDPVIRLASRGVHDVLASLPVHDLAILLKPELGSDEQRRRLLARLAPHIERAVKALME